MTTWYGRSLDNNNRTFIQDGASMIHSRQIPVVLVMMLLVVACGAEKQGSIPAAPHFDSYAVARAVADSTGQAVLVNFYSDS